MCAMAALGSSGGYSAGPPPIPCQAGPFTPTSYKVPVPKAASVTVFAAILKPGAKPPGICNVGSPDVHNFSTLRVAARVMKPLTVHGKTVEFAFVAANNLATKGRATSSARKIFGDFTVQFLDYNDAVEQVLQFKEWDCKQKKDALEKLVVSIHKNSGGPFGPGAYKLGGEEHSFVVQGFSAGEAATIIGYTLKRLPC
jgi:hypothetical protein